MFGFIFPNRFFILLCGGACLFLSCNRGDLPQQLAACADAITQIEFSQGGDTATLTEIDGKWVVNHGRAVRAGRLSNWRRVALNWRLRPIVFDETIKQKITTQVVREGVHTAVFTGRHNHPTLTFYISNIAYTGTVVCYGEQLFLADIPYTGYEVMDVFNATPGYWKDATVFACLPFDLDTVTVEHLQRPEASFQLVRDGNGWQPVAAGSNQATCHHNEALINRYVTYFQRVEADAVIGRLPGPELTAIRRHLQHRINVKSAKGNLTVELFGIPLKAENGYDTDKCLLFMVETGEWARASWVSFDLLLRDLNDFVDKK
ncbi:MAG: hypothetical protein LBD52_04925 [Prevotellaceae bacterium]|jgi:hypothetical protein|nr:hypothetical protein [Prevotellaceae bacterium]